MIKFTKQELEDYLAGKLKLVTSKHTGKSKLVPATPNPLDKGVTSPDKRAYYRLWYLKNREQLQKDWRKKRAPAKQVYKDIKERDKSLPPVPKGQERRKRGTLKTKEQRRAANREYNRRYQARLRAAKAAAAGCTASAGNTRHVPLKTGRARRRSNVIQTAMNFLFGW